MVLCNKRSKGNLVGIQDCTRNCILSLNKDTLIRTCATVKF